MALSYNFVQVFGAGKLALSERPKIKEIKDLNSAGCNRLVTILSATGEQAHKIGEEVEFCGMDWDWLQVANAGYMTPAEKILFKRSVQAAFDAIQNNESVLVHCSAGLHRTGIFAYTLLRKEHSKEEALQIIQEIRQQTYDAFEEKYLVLAEEIFR